MRQLLILPLGIAVLEAAELKLVNATGGWDIHEVYIVPIQAESWGEDLLAGTVVAQGGSWETELSPGLYSIRVLDEDGDAYTRPTALVTSSYVWEVTLADLEGHSATSSG